MLDQCAHRIESKVMIDELSEISIESRNAAFFVVSAVLRRIEIGGHLGAQDFQVSLALIIVLAVLSRGQRSKHPAETPLRQRRVRCRHFATQGFSMSSTH